MSSKDWQGRSEDGLGKHRTPNIIASRKKWSRETNLGDKTNAGNQCTPCNAIATTAC